MGLRQLFRRLPPHLTIGMVNRQGKQCLDRCRGLNLPERLHIEQPCPGHRVGRNGLHERGYHQGIIEFTDGNGGLLSRVRLVQVTTQPLQLLPGGNLCGCNRLCLLDQADFLRSSPGPIKPLVAKGLHLLAVRRRRRSSHDTRRHHHHQPDNTCPESARHICFIGKTTQFPSP